MKQKLFRMCAAIALASTLAACQGSGSVSLTNPLPAIQGYLQSLRSSVGAKDTVLQTSANATVQQQAAPDLTPYRSEFDQTTNVWVVYYYSPSKNKSYRCKPNPDKSVTVTEVTDTTLVYQQGDTIDVTKVNVDAAAAAQTAVTQAAADTTASPSPSPTATPTPVATATAVASPGASPAASPSASPTATPTATPAATAAPSSGNTTIVNNTTVIINQVYLISPGELRKKHGRHSDNPVYVVVTNNQPIFIDASTGARVTATEGSSVNIGSGTSTATTTTTTSPSVAPSAAAH